MGLRVLPLLMPQHYLFCDMMTIDDKRQVSKWVPAVALLRPILSFIPQEYTKGIRKIILLDSDCHQSQSTARGRYVAIDRTNFADVEIYLQTFETIPGRLRENKVFLTYQLAVILMHELYHHSVRGLRIRRKRKDKQEEAKAENWSLRRAEDVLHKIYPPDQFKAEYEKITEIHRQAHAS